MSVGASNQTSAPGGGYSSERSELESELQGLKTDRYSWWVHWGQLATYLLPRRYRWLVTANQMNRGSPINGAIMDSTGTIALRVMASGMMSGITSPTRPWFKLKIAGFPDDEVSPVARWLASCQRRMLHVFQESNFYNGIAVVYSDLGCFGTAPMIIYEDFENIIHCENPCAGEYYAANGKNLTVETFAREITLTVRAIVQQFGLENCSTMVQNCYRTGGASLSQEVAVVHFIKPNTGAMPDRFKWYECYFERGATGNDVAFLRRRGFFEQPFICPRWDTTGNDAYGRSVGMDALGDIKQLQQETKRKAQAIDKLANPPMVADVELRNQPASTLPGGVTYTAKRDGAGFKPAYENFRPPINEMMQDISLVQNRIKDIFFNDLFLMISSLETVRTATEIDARREEKLVMLGPVLERFQTEGLDIVVDRTFAIMMRAGLFEEPPEEIRSAVIEVEYVSMLAEAQRAANTTSIERLWAQLGNIAAIRPEVLDTVNWDRSIVRYGLVLGNEPSDMNTPDEIAAIRAERQKQAQAQQAAQSGAAAVDYTNAAKNLSETNVGGGTSALQSILGGGPVQ